MCYIEINGSMIVANCIPTGQCLGLNCTQLTSVGTLGSLSQQLEFTNCQISCCGSNLCNTGVKATKPVPNIFEITTAPVPIATSTLGADVTTAAKSLVDEITTGLGRIFYKPYFGINIPLFLTASWEGSATERKHHVVILDFA